jgi:hypothetical protein
MMQMVLTVTDELSMLAKKGIEHLSNDEATRMVLT